MWVDVFDQQEKMWRKGRKGYGTQEPEAIFGEQKYNWREWEAEEKS